MGELDANGFVQMLKNDLIDICSFWAEEHPAGKSVAVLSPVEHAFKSVGQWLAGLVDPTWRIKIGMGQGRVASVPYVVALPPGQKTSNGLYVVICFGKAGNGFVVGAAISVSSVGKNPLLAQIKTIHRANPVIDVNGHAQSCQYNDSFVNPLEIGVASIDEHGLQRHVEESINICKSNLAMGKNGAGVGEVPGDGPNMLIENLSAGELESFRLILSDEGLQYDDAFVRRFFAAVQSKQFVVLTGLSGSGKTQLAIQFCEFIAKGRSTVVSVGADWTNNEKMLGYPDAVNCGKYVRPESGVLDLVLRASMDPDRPYVLVLDEMNLSHVERYFADFLSAMESKGELKLHGGAEPLDGVPSTVKMPENLWVIGTMNVDETTYMFSPKVLDRAQVLEFRVRAEDMKKFLEGKQTAAAEALNGFFPVLAKVGAEFGYRTAGEFCSYVEKAIALKSPVDEAVDTAIMQKLLPKLHGSRRQLERPLEALWKLCLKADVAASVETLAKAEGEIDVFPYGSNCKYPISGEKIARIYRNAKNNGFASYAEA